MCAGKADRMHEGKAVLLFKFSAWLEWDFRARQKGRWLEGRHAMNIKQHAAQWHAKKDREEEEKRRLGRRKEDEREG
jgi:hypothetical protein